MGGSASKLEKTLGESFPESERIFGLENFGNTCYCNSILQALYFCVPFRKKILQYHRERERTKKTFSTAPKLPLTSDADNDENLMTCLGDLFEQIGSQKKRSGSLAPKKFVNRLRKDNELFRSHMHQDAQEFLNYLLNEIVEILEKEAKNNSPQSPRQNGTSTKPVMKSLGFDAEDDTNDLEKDYDGKDESEEENGTEKKPKTWVHDIFEGVLENKTRCLRCENVTSRDESFLDLSLDIMQNSSISACLRNFEHIEMMAGDEKFYCDKCSSLQEAQRWMRIKKPPQVLALHLKRFKFIESLGRHKKLSYRVVFPQELRLNYNIDEDMYELFAVVVHVGSGPNHGHYICLVRSHDRWLTFDDDDVRLLEDGQLQHFFGSTSDATPTNEHGYMLFYMRRF